MKIRRTLIEGVFVVEQDPKVDERGYFVRTFAKEILRKSGVKYNIVHINKSFTKQRGTIRGLHYQVSPFREDKIVQCLTGGIFDVAVDIRRKSSTFGKWIGIELSEDNNKMLLIPKGCAHGFQTLKPNSLVEYFVTEYYSAVHERGIAWNDSCFKIKWPVKKVHVSERDRKWQPFVK